MGDMVLLSSALLIVGGVIVIGVPAILAYVVGAVLILKGLVDLAEGMSKGNK